MKFSLNSHHIQHLTVAASLEGYATVIHLSTVKYHHEKSIIFGQCVFLSYLRVSTSMVEVGKQIVPL